MTKSFYSEMERIIAANSNRGLETMMFYYGISLGLYRATKVDVYSQVHAGNSGGPTNFVRDFNGIVVSDDFSNSAGLVTKYTQAYLYPEIRDPLLLVGDEIRINGEDDRTTHYIITDKESIGLTQEAIVRYKLSNLAEV